ncbi:unnamed protein product [Bursaphelenchus xylophilus]|uniref:(pine wood nematode) hypothetical protein n=1 Tax=Bursaphelenchus xylophilus TaxID=6326 RepID=A0A1I7RY35_BURXY|nr:unnamed protein product [Bursaphelenchus xylophilus]CAG9085239.1 unnamed protein product [Bursaphelenchus xylophilus]
MFGSGSAFGSKPSGLFGSFNSPSTNLGTSTFNSNSTQAQPSSIFGATNSTQQNQNPNNDVEVPQTPDDAVQALKFNPASNGAPMLLAAGSWDFTCRIWQISESGQVEPKAMQNVGAPVLGLDWFDDSSKVFMACADKQARVWDLASNQVAIVGTHDSPVKSCHWITSPSYNCLMTGGWDKTLRFWDMRQLPTQSSLATINLPDKVFCTDLLYPFAVVGLGNRRIKQYKLEGQPQEFSDIESPLKHQSRCVSIFKNKMNNQPAGFALGSIEGRVAIQTIESSNAKDNFTFKCHRSPDLVNGFQEIYPINDVCFHPIHYTLATVGGDGRFMLWDKDARTKLKNSEQMPKQITKCHVHHGGNVMAYATGYDWSKGHEGNIGPTNAKIYLHAVADEMKPRQKK